MTLDPRADAVIDGRYRLERVLGEGGMGTVWAARDQATDEEVALKFFKAGSHDHDDTIRRFMREARAAMAVQHPNVVRIRELGSADETPFIVMDLLRGESLATRLMRERVLHLSLFARIFLPVISAVGTAHAMGIVHRDLKPDNIFLVDTGDGSFDVRVLDFGIAKLTAVDGLAARTAETGTATGSLLGTPHYMSPEQVFGEKDVDYRSDLWALGVIMYECLAGARPFAGDNVGQVLKGITTGAIPSLADVAPHLPSAVLDLNRRMLQMDRSKRPQDLREVQALLRPFTDVEAISFTGPTLRAQSDSFGTMPSGNVLAVTPPSASAASLPVAPPQRRGVGLLVVVALAVVVGGGAVLALRRSPPIPPAPYIGATASGGSASAAAAIDAPSSPSVATSSTAAAPSVAPPPPPVAAPIGGAPTVKAAPKSKPSAAPPASMSPPPPPVTATATSKKPPGGVAPENPFQ